MRIPKLKQIEIFKFFFCTLTAPLTKSISHAFGFHWDSLKEHTLRSLWVWRFQIHLLDSSSRFLFKILKLRFGKNSGKYLSSNLELSEYIAAYRWSPNKFNFQFTFHHIQWASSWILCTQDLGPRYVSKKWQAQKKSFHSKCIFLPDLFKLPINLIGRPNDNDF